MNQDLRAAYRILSQLEKSKSLGDRVFDSLPGVYLMVDPSGSILRANTQTASLLKLKSDDVLGQNLTRFFHESSHSRVLERLEHIGNGTEETIEFELPLIDINGIEHAYHWIVSRLPTDRNVDLALMSVVGRDVSELKVALRSVFSLEQDLGFARIVQTLLLPIEHTAETDVWKMAAHYQPAAQAGGDWWKFEKREDGSALFLIGDVTGHGIGAGMVTAMVTGAYSACIASHGTDDIPRIFHEINRQLNALRGHSYWMTLMALDFDPLHDVVTCYSAASPPALLIKPGASKAIELGQAGKPLGSGHLSFVSETASMDPGDRLFCFTDGLIELSPDISQSSLRRRILRALQRDFGNPLEARVNVLREWSRFAKGLNVEDDVSFMIIDSLKPQS